MTFLETSPELTGITFNSYVRKAAQDALIGPETADRLKAFGGNILSNQTIDELEEVIDGSRPPNVPKTTDTKLGNSVAPLVRTFDVFSPGDIVRYHTAAQASSWLRGGVDIARITPIGMSQDPVIAIDPPAEETKDRRSIVVREFGNNGSFFDPTWPALMPDALYEAIMSRPRARGKNPEGSWRAYGRVYIQLSCFDPQIKSPVFLTAVRVALRHLDT